MNNILTTTSFFDLSPKSAPFCLYLQASRCSTKTKVLKYLREVPETIRLGPTTIIGQ